MINVKWFIFQVYFVVICLTILKPEPGYGGRKYTREHILKLREEVREMFNHAYSGYLKYAYPYDELRPLSCDGVDTWGSYSLTLIDALDTLAVMGNFSEFRRVVDIVTSKANFDANINVSVFETNIRIVGGLLSAHLLSQRAGVELEPGWPCNGPLLRLAEDVAKRLIAAFDTSTGMPYGTVNLRYGVPPGETSITCTAGVGTFILEFGALSRLTGDPIYEEVALNALYALYHHRSSIGLYGNHIDVLTGRWTAQDSGIGAGVDSYLEYLVKGALLVQRPELIAIFNEGRVAIDKHLKRNDWYLWVSMHKGQVTLPVFQSLEAYWPGVLSLIGDISGGMKSMHNYHQVWKQYGFTPEFYNIAQGQVGTNRESYPLRPELIESTMYLYRATKDPFLLDVGMDILRSIQHSAKTKCGYATIKDCRDHSLENRMESFFLAETTKYLYLLFDPDNFIHNDGRQGTVHTLPSGRECILDAGGYIFNTEAHPLDPGALLCCSENINEPKRYNRKSARGEKFTSFVRHEQGEQTPAIDPKYSLPLQSDEQPLPDLPSAFTDEEPATQTGEEFLDKLEESGAVDVVKVPPPSYYEVHPLNKEHQRKISPNMMEMIESLINNNHEKHLLKTARSHDMLKELVEVIENAEKILNREINTIKENNKAPESNQNLQSSTRISELKESVSRQALENEHSSQTSQTETVSVPENVGKTDDSAKDTVSSLSKITVENTGTNISFSDKTDKKIYHPELNTTNTANESLTHDFSKLTDTSLNDSEKLKENKKEKTLFELVIVQQFKIIKDTTLKEADLIMFHLKTCLENLELTKNLVELTNDHELKSQFLTRRLEVMILATDIKRSIEKTRKLLNSEEFVEGIEVVLFKRLMEVVVDSKSMKDFLDKYKNYMEIAKRVIAIGKENYDSEQANGKTSSQEESLSNSEGDVNESGEISTNYVNEESEKNFFQTNDWKIDDISFQVDDTERVVPVSKVDPGPLFTDKLRLKTEAVVGLLPKSLVSSEIPFDPQVLLERIRSSPRYYRNTTWMTQYELLTCLPQPYFTRIMLSGEFFND